MRILLGMHIIGQMTKKLDLLFRVLMDVYCPQIEFVHPLAKADGGSL